MQTFRSWLRALLVVGISTIVSILTVYYTIGAFKFYEVGLELTKLPVFAFTSAALLFVLTITAAFSLNEHPSIRVFLWGTKGLIAYLYARHVQSSDLIACTLVLFLADVAATIVAHQLVALIVAARQANNR